MWTDGADESAIARGVFDTYVKRNLRYSQVAPLSMYEEKNTGSNLPAQIEIMAVPGGEYAFHFMAKGGGSANKTFLFQETKALLNPTRLMAFMEEKIKLLGTAACPPYHLAVVIGGLSAEMTLKTVKMASARYYDNLHTTCAPASAAQGRRLQKAGVNGAGASGPRIRRSAQLDRRRRRGSAEGRAFRDVELEAAVHALTQRMGIGAQVRACSLTPLLSLPLCRQARVPRSCAQFGGKYFCHDVRIIRLPRHGASCPVGIGVSCSADRQAVGKITEDGVFLEALERDPAKYLPEVAPEALSGDVVKINLNQPMSAVLETLRKCPVRTRVSLTGPLVVARDIAHAKLKERLDAGQGLPQYMKARGRAHPALLVIALPVSSQFKRSRGLRRRAGLRRVLRWAGEDAGGLRQRLVRADHGGPHGFIRGPVPGARSSHSPSRVFCSNA